jgi:biopolymer transport protein ExbB
MVPLGFLSVAAIGLTVYGFVTVQTAKMLRPDLVPQLQDDLVNLRLDDARTACTGAPCLLTNTLAAGLERISDGVLDVESMEKAMEEASVQETTAGMRPINYLSIIAQIAPMLGLLGTVSGMIKAFQKIGLGGMGRPELLATNIGEAMVTTATGLIIGIPAMFFYFFLKSRYMTNVSQLGRILGNLSHHLVAASRRAAGGGMGMDAAGAVAARDMEAVE